MFGFVKFFKILYMEVTLSRGNKLPDCFRRVYNRDKIKCMNGPEEENSEGAIVLQDPEGTLSIMNQVLCFKPNQIWRVGKPFSPNSPLKYVINPDCSAPQI